MSTGEVIGLAVAAGLVGGLIGAIVIAVLQTRRQDRFGVKARRIDAYARWLAARLALSRASLSFVSAFRVLAAEPRDSTYFALRTEEAQRVRSQWCDAVREVDLAEATLIAWAEDPSLPLRLEQFDRVGVGALRRAVAGSDEDVDALVNRLHESDQRAAEFVGQATGHLLSDRPAWRRVLAAAAWHLDDLLTGGQGGGRAA
jgi:hypothetical protein